MTTGSFRSLILSYLDPEVAEELAWQRKAACLGRWEHEDYFPAKGKSADAAKRVCLSCTVRAECLTDALTRNEREGCWGGTTEKERRPLLREVVRRTNNGEDRADVIASIVAKRVPKVRIPYRPSTPESKAYAAWLIRRQTTGVAA